MNNIFKTIFSNKISLLARNVTTNLSVHSKNIFSFKTNLLSTSNFFKTIPQVTVQQTRDYKTKMRLRKRCKACVFEWKNGRIYVDCKAYPSHKQHHLYSLERGYDNLAHGFHINLKRKLPKRRYPSLL